MRRCAFLTTDSLEGFVSDDELALEPLNTLGWSVDSVSWRDQHRNWDQYEAVIIRTTWDYHKQPEAFLRALQKIDDSGARLANPLDLVRWNLHKSYLRDLSSRGVRVVPTHWGSDLDQPRLLALFDLLATNEIVVKPAVGASADDTFRVSRSSARDVAAEIERVFRSRDYLAQPFLQTVVDEGEYSLFYFGGEHSHTILKVPLEGDFRVQEEHGGDISAVIVDRTLIERGVEVINQLEVEPLYARVDYVRDQDDEFALMELELIEPALYFRNAPHSAEHFARAFDEWMRLK